MYRLKSWNKAFSRDVTAAILVSQSNKTAAMLVFQTNKPFPSSPVPLYQNEVKCSAFDMEMIIHSYANETHFHKKGILLGLALNVRVSGTHKWPVCVAAGHVSENAPHLTNSIT